MTYRGIDLKLRRVALRVGVTDLGRAMGVTHSRVSHIETRAVVTPEAASRYLAALATFVDVDSTEAVSA